MNWLFKLAGMLLIFSTCIAVGFLKSFNLKQRAEGLHYYHNSLNVLSERILRERGEIKTILPQSFKNGDVYIENGRIIADIKGLDKKDKELSEEFLTELGKLDIKGEYDRTKLYSSLFENEAISAEKQYNEQSKLYRSLGVMAGIFVCIFLW